MNRLFDRKSKKPPKLSQQHIILGIPAGIAAGPLGFRAELDIDPKGEQSHSSHDSEVDGPDPTVVPDEKDTRASRVVFQENKSEDRGFAAIEVSTPGAVVGGTEHGNDPAS
jgi:hypothetical protein